MPSKEEINAMHATLAMEGRRVGQVQESGSWPESIYGFAARGVSAVQKKIARSARALFVMTTVGIGVLAGADDNVMAQLKKTKQDEATEKIVRSISTGAPVSELQVRELYYNSSNEIFEASMYLYLGKGDPKAAGELLKIIAQGEHVSMDLRMRSERHLTEAAKKHPTIVHHLIHKELSKGYQHSDIAAGILGKTGQKSLPSVHAAFEGLVKDSPDKEIEDSERRFISYGAGNALRGMFRQKDDNLDKALILNLKESLYKKPEKEIVPSRRERTAELLFYREEGFKVLAEGAKADIVIAEAVLKAVTVELAMAKQGEFLPLNKPKEIAKRWKDLLFELRTHPSLHPVILTLLQRLEDEEKAAEKQLELLKPQKK